MSQSHEDGEDIRSIVGTRDSSDSLSLSSVLKSEVEIEGLDGERFDELRA